MTTSPLSEPAWDTHWDTRWDAPWAAPDEPEPQPLVRRRRLVTHVVLVDGLPADHWVEESADGTWESRGRRRGPLRSFADAEPTHERALRWLEAAVGGADALRALDASPLTVTPVALDQVPADLHARARSISDRCDAVATDVFDTPELVAAFRHILTAVLTLDPGTLHRSDRDETAVGAVVWIGGQANGLIGPRGAVLARELWDLLDISSSAAARGAGILHRLTGRAVDPDPPVHWGAPHLRATGMPGALLSSTRAVLVARRDAAWADVDAAGGRS
ncbi:MAG: hypothetical protein ACXV2I_15475 [Actinomycetes bacterium]